MKRNYYIFSSGKLIRKNNTLYFEPGENAPPSEKDEEEIIMPAESEEPEDDDYVKPVSLGRKPVPVDDVEALYCFSELQFNTRFFNFLSLKQITAHFFNYYGFYTGSFYPKAPYISGNLLVHQIQNYLNHDMRIKIAQKFVKGAADNIIMNLQYYNSRDHDLEDSILRIKKLAKEISSSNEISGLMGIEGNIHDEYYKTWNTIINSDLKIFKRVKRPPDNPINAMISFLNSMVYTTVLSEIYKTQLNPLISFLHEPGERRFSLALDISEVFKPLFSDRIIFSLFNKNQIQEKHFTKELNFCHLNEDGRKIVVREFDEKLKTTIKHRTLNKSVNYRQLIRLECYKLIKHLLGDKEYKPFKIWW